MKMVTKGGSSVNGDIEEKRQRILKMVEEYGDEEDKNLERDKILSYDENVEKVYTLFSTKEKDGRDILLEKYQKEANEEREIFEKEYVTQRDKLYKLVGELKNLVRKFEEMRQTQYDKDEADKLLDNVN